MSKLERKNEVEYNGDFTAGNLDEDIQAIDMTHTSPSSMIANGASVEPVRDYHGLKDLAAYEAFMQEPVMIQLHRSHEKNSYQMVPVGINGEEKWIPRGVPVILKRKFVERLAQAQSTSLTTVENTDKTSDSGYINRRTTGHDYPFDVIRDNNRLGRRWLQSMMKQGCGR